MHSNEPFIGSEAVKAGMLRCHHLRSRFRGVFPDVYVRRDQQLTLRDRAVAAWLWSRRQGVLAGLTAAAWHGARWVDEGLPVELVWSNLRPPRGVRTYDVQLLPEEVRVVADVPNDAGAHGIRHWSASDDGYGDRTSRRPDASNRDHD